MRQEDNTHVKYVGGGGEGGHGEKEAAEAAAAAAAAQEDEDEGAAFGAQTAPLTPMAVTPAALDQVEGPGPLAAAVTAAHLNVVRDLPSADRDALAPAVTSAVLASQASALEAFRAVWRMHCPYVPNAKRAPDTPGASAGSGAGAGARGGAGTDVDVGVDGLNLTK